MNGEMLWLNREKGSGFIRTERAERLYVARRGFLPAPVPVARCVGAVRFERIVAEGDTRAVNVSFVSEAAPPRGDGRRGTGRSSRREKAWARARDGSRRAITFVCRSLRDRRAE